MFKDLALWNNLETISLLPFIIQKAHPSKKQYIKKATIEVQNRIPETTIPIVLLIVILLIKPAKERLKNTINNTVFIIEIVA